MNLKDQLDTKLKRAGDLKQIADARDLSAAELAEVDTLVTDIKSLREHVGKASADAALIGRLGKARRQLTADQEGRAMFGAGVSGEAFMPPAATLAKSVTDHILRSVHTDADRKALPAGGATITPVELDTNVVDSAKVSLNLLNLIPVQTRTTPTYQWLQQATRVMNAAVVAPGAVKPTSTMSVTPKSGRLHVVAHLSEALDKFLLEDASNLATWVQGQLVAGLYEALQTEILSGDGTGEHLTGLGATSGIQTVAFHTDQITTLSYAISALETVGVAPAAFAVAPADLVAMTTVRTSAGAFDLGGPAQVATRSAWGVPLVPVAGLTAGTAWLLGADTLNLSTDGTGIRVEWGMPGDLFTRNQVQARVEGRFNLDVRRPFGIAKVTLASS